MLDFTPVSHTFYDFLMTLAKERKKRWHYDKAEIQTIPDVCPKLVIHVVENHVNTV